MTKSLVINPPFLEPHRPPISSAILAEILRLENHQVAVSDLNIEIYHQLGSDRFHDLQIKVTTENDGDSIKELQNLLVQSLEVLDLSQYQWTLISCFSYWNLVSMTKICEYIKQKSNCRIVIGGPGVEYENVGVKLQQQGLVDFCVYGEAESVLPRLLRGEQDLPGVNGRAPDQIMDIENLPLPNYGYFDFSRYVWLLDKPDVFIYGSRGCVRRCTFCDVAKYWPKYRWRSGRSIADEMISNYERFGVQNFFFADSLVNGNQKEFRIMCEILARYHPGLFRWAAYAIVRPRSAHPAELFDLIQASGGKFWSIGIETGVDRIRYEMDKKFSNDDIDWHLEQSQRIGLQNNFLCIGTWPSETLAEHEEYLQMFERWQNYAVDGTIFGIKISTALALLDGTPISRQIGKEIQIERFTHDVPSYISHIAWYVSDNPDLTHKEKFRRVLALHEQAIKYKWPLTNCLQSLHELQSLLEATIKFEKSIKPRKIIPLSSH